MCCEKKVTYKIMRGTNCFGEIETKIFADDYEFNNEQLITGLYKAGYINTDCVNDYFIEGRSDGVLVVYVVYNIEYRYALFRLEEITETKTLVITPEESKFLIAALDNQYRLLCNDLKENDSETRAWKIKGFMGICEKLEDKLLED